MKYLHDGGLGRNRLQTIRADLVGSTTCTAAGIMARGPTPVLALCRELIAAGLDPDKALEVYRGATLALRIRSVAQAARLEIATDGVGFRRRRQPDAGLPVEFSGVGRAELAVTAESCDWPADAEVLA